MAHLTCRHRSRRPRRRRYTGMAGIPFGGTWGLVVVVIRGKEYRLTVRDHTVELSAFWHVIRRIPTKSALLLPPFWLPFAPSIVPPPNVHLRGIGKENLRRNPRPRRLWERNRGTTAAWNQRVSMCRSTPGFLSYSLVFRSLNFREKFFSISFYSNCYLDIFSCLVRRLKLLIN